MVCLTGFKLDIVRKFFLCCFSPAFSGRVGAVCVLRHAQGLAPDPQCISNLPKSAFAAGRCFERFSDCCEKSVFEELQFVEMHKKHLVLYAKNAIIRHSLYKCPCAALCGAGREAV